MLTREAIPPTEKEAYNLLATHVLQSWEWGEFREKTGVRVIRAGLFDKKKLVEAYQLTLHRVPYIPSTIGYLPKGPAPDQEMFEVLEDVGREQNTIFFKLEPNIFAEHPLKIKDFRFQPAIKPLFTKYTFQVDLQKSEEELMSRMKEKTRYNVRLAQKNGVEVREDNSPEAFEIYLKLTSETTRRQKFYAHSEGYHRLMWETLRSPSATSGQAPIAHLLIAYLGGQPLVAWILFNFHQVLYYPYGASSGEHREVMASNLMMWEAIKFGKKHDCHTFDLWGALGPNPDPKDPWYGFHRFKEGYGGELVEFVGSYDFILNPPLYKIYNLADSWRWKLLKTLAKIRR